MNQNSVKLRPDRIKDVSLWWQRRLDEAFARGEPLEEPPAVAEVTAQFSCSEEEALRGLWVGEQRHWSGAGY